MMKVILHVLIAPCQNVNVLLSMSCVLWNNADRRLQCNKLKFFLLYLLFFIFSSNFIDSESGVTIRNQLRIRRLDTRRHRARDHSTRHRPLPTYWWSFGTQSLSPAIFEIMGNKHIGSRPWPFRVVWRHRSHDHSIHRWAFPVVTPLSPNISSH